MSIPRGLSAEEAALWRRVTATVTPLHPAREISAPALSRAGEPQVESKLQPAPKQRKATVKARVPGLPHSRERQPDLQRHGLDGSWERRLAKAQVDPELAIDLHGLNLDQAHDRVVGSIGQALAMGARVVLVIAGKQRPQAEHDLRGQRRGAIRAKLLDWLAASPHAARIAAVRPAHPRHGGAGAVYVVLRRLR